MSRWVLALSIAFLSVSFLHAQEPVTAAAGLERLKAGNARFAADKMEKVDLGDGRRQELAKGQKPFAVILGCADSRVAPELIFNQGLGDLFVIRVAGNVADPGVLGSIEYAVEHMNVPLVIVLGHESCGAVEAALGGALPPGNLGWLIKHVDVGPNLPKDPKAAMTAGIEHNVLHQTRQLTERSKVIQEFAQSNRVTIVPAVYSLSTGKVEWLESKAPARLIVRVPTPDARVWFDDGETKSRGLERVFNTPPLPTERAALYQLRVAWMVDGKAVQIQKVVRVLGGTTVSVDVSTASPTKEIAIFEPGAKLKIEAEGEGGGEGPAWHPKLGVFTSGGDGHLHLLGPDGKQRIFKKNAGTNGLLFDRDGNLVSCDSAARRVSRTDLEGKATILTEAYEGKRYNNPNDLTIDSKGRIYFTDPRYGSRDGMEIRDDKGRTIEGVYRIDPDGKVTRIIGRELERPNGILVSPDDQFLFVADNNNDTKGGARKLWRFELNADGTVHFKTKKLLYDWKDGRGPDGLKQDRAGRLYVAGGLNKPNPPFEPATDKKGGIYVLTPEGELLTFLNVPRDEVTNCAFGGPDLRTLYITGGGTLFSIRTTTPGRVLWP